jgi:hypothetical protein
MKKIFFFAALCLMSVALTAQEDYELRILTFEDEDAKFSEYTLEYGDYPTITTWSDLIDDPQYGGPLLYGEMGMGMEAPYRWYDEGNTELMHESPMGYGTYCYWSGGHAISNYVCEDVASEYRNYGDMNGQLTVCATSGNNGSANFAMHYGYMDGSSYNLTEYLPALTFGDGVARVIDHMYVHMNAYLLNCILHGNELTDPVGEIDYVKLEATGYDENEEATGTVEIYVCTSPMDFVTEWTKWDLSELGEVVRVEFNVLGTNDNGYGFSQPAYFAYDDVAVRFPKEVVEIDPVVVEYTESACDSYTWNGVEYTESGVYMDTLQTIQGGDSIEILNLTINYTQTATFTETAVGSFDWNGITLTESGDYIDTLQTLQGCDSIVILHLTITTQEEPKDYDLRILTFEDEDAKFEPFYMGDSYAEITQWSDLIDDAQMEGTLLYGGYMWSMSEPYWWYDQYNTELMHTMPYNFYTYCYAGGGHAISNFASTDYETYGDQYSQLTVYGEEGQGGYNGSANFAMHFGYIDGSPWNGTEYLPALTFGDGEARVIDHMYVNNGTYAINCYMNGNGLTAAIGEEDWVKLLATGYDENGEETGCVEIYLCNGPDDITMEWKKWDLSPLGKVVEVQFNVTGSSDNGYGFSQPAYFAYDNVAVRFPKENTGNEGGGVTTEITNTHIASSPNSHKILYNGQLLIVHEGKVYNVNGIKLK